VKCSGKFVAASASVIAQALPIPFPAFVTKTVLFFKLNFLRYLLIKITLSHYKLILRQPPVLLIILTNQSIYIF